MVDKEADMELDEEMDEEVYEEVAKVGWLSVRQVRFSLCPAPSLHLTARHRPFLRARPNFHTTIISAPMDTPFKTIN